MAEEPHLTYVRLRWVGDWLFPVHASRRTRCVSGEASVLSRFLEDSSADLITGSWRVPRHSMHQQDTGWEGAHRAAVVNETPSGPEFCVGQQMVHTVSNEGIGPTSRVRGSNEIVTVNFEYEGEAASGQLCAYGGGKGVEATAAIRLGATEEAAGLSPAASSCSR